VPPATVNLECFTVGPVTPGLDTLAVIPNPADPPVPPYVAVPSGYKTPFGSPVYDTAALTGAATEPGTNGAANGGVAAYPSINATDGAFAGAIKFKLLGPDDCATTATGTGSNPSADVSVTGNTTYGPVSFTPNHAGTFHWVATYTNTGSVNNASPVSHNTLCGDQDEDVVVQQIPTEIKSAQSWFPNDFATITSTVTGDNLVAGGTVDFSLYNDASCGKAPGTGTVQYSERQTLAGGTHSEQVRTHNYTDSTAKVAGGANTIVTPFEITTLYADGADSVKGPYSWKIVYAPLATDSLHTGKQSFCTAGSTEKFSITYTNDGGPGTNLP